MHVTSYQMHNVLDCYSRQLSRAHRGGGFTAASGDGGVAAGRSEAGGKREATWEAVCLDIYNKLTDLKALDSARDETAPAVDERQQRGQHQESALRQPATFEYNVIDRLDRKITNQVSVEDSSGLVQRLENGDREALGEKK